MICATRAEDVSSNPDRKKGPSPARAVPTLPCLYYTHEKNRRQLTNLTALHFLSNFRDVTYTRFMYFTTAKQTDFSVVVKSRGKLPNPWKWEIYRAGRSSAVAQSSEFFAIRETKGVGCRFLIIAESLIYHQSVTLVRGRMTIFMTRTLQFWVEVEYECLREEKSDHPKAQLLSEILRRYKEAGDAMRYLDRKGRVSWKASPRMLARLADAEREVEDDWADHD
jgi:hypothetical protein